MAKGRSLAIFQMMKSFLITPSPQSVVSVFDAAFTETQFAIGPTRKLNVKTVTLFIESGSIIIQQPHKPAVYHKASVMLVFLPSSLMSRATVEYSTSLSLASRLPALIVIWTPTSLLGGRPAKS